MKNKYYGIGLDNPKFNVNVGKVLRAAYVYNADFVALTGKRYKRTQTDTMKYHIYKPVFNVDDLHKMIPFDCIPIAVDKIDGAIPLPKYKHPKRAFYVFGAEDNTLGKRIIEWCRDIVYIPMGGCMNLGAAVNVVLYDRMAKEYLNQG